MNKIINIYKPQGMTPVQLIEQFRERFPEYGDLKIGFAGRLDPLAHGVMLLTIGEENKERQKYLGLNKTYQFSVLFGMVTDTYDYLGLLKNLEVIKLPENFLGRFKEFANRHIGKLTQTYPPFSSKTLNGTPLFKLAKKGLLTSEDLPTREIEIFEFKFIKVQSIRAKDIRKQILKNLRRVKGHFRQGKIIKKWGEFFEVNQEVEFLIADFEIDCSSGTYVRSLANKLGEELGCGAIAFEIFRTKVGEYKIDDSLKLQF